MTDAEIARRLAEIEGISDPSERAIRVAILVGRAFRDEGHKMVLVGGSAVEFYTDGLYVSGDVDICYFGRASDEVTLNVMGRLGSRTKGRHYEIAGCFVEILGTIESNAQTEFLAVSDENGEDAIYVDMVEEVIAERVYRAGAERREKDIDCATKLLGVCVRDSLEVNWDEVRRLLRSGLYRSEPVLDELLRKVRRELGIDEPQP